MITLHLFLRISDVLIKLLIRQLKREDAIDKKARFNSGFARDKFKHMDAYEKFLHSLEIAFEWTVDSISLFNQQGLEKYNDQASKDYLEELILLNSSC